MNLIRITLNVGSIVLVAILGWLVMRIALGVTQPESLYEPEPIVVPVRTASAGRASVVYDFSTDPFSFGEITAPPLDLLDDAPETTLNLKLIGIVSESSATFRLADGKDKPVKIDEDVMNGVTLTRTAKDFVTLDVNGDTQKLTLERVKIGEKANAPKILRAAPKEGAASPLPTQAEAEDLFKQVQLTPKMEILPDRTTRMIGFQINARAGADLSKFNLQSGDILTRVGPVLLNTNRTNTKELRNLITTGSAQDYEVIRNGVPITILIGQ